MSKPTIAVCISGQMRNWEYPMTRLAAYLKTFEATYFVATWRSRGAKSTGPWNIDQLRRIMPPAAARVFPKQFVMDAAFVGIPALGRSLMERNGRREVVVREDILRVLPGAHINIADDDLLDATLGNVTFREPNSYRMLYQLSRCVEMVRAHESETRATFDYFIRVRPDMLVLASPEKEIISALPGVISGDWVNMQMRIVGDSIAWGYRSDLDAYVQLSGYLESVIRNQPALDRWRNIHRELFECIHSSGRTIGCAAVPRQIMSEYMSYSDLVTCVDESINEVDEVFVKDLELFKNLLISLGHLESGEFAKARHYAELGLERNPTSAGAFVILSQASRGLRDFVRALSESGMALVHASDDATDDYIVQYVRDFISSVDKTSAISCLEEILFNFSSAARLREILDQFKITMPV